MSNAKRVAQSPNQELTFAAAACYRVCTMLRRSVSFTPTLNYRIEFASKTRGQTVSAYIAEIMDRELATQEQSKLKQVYSGLQQLKGIGSKGDTDASRTIDETLYGEQGAWRGSER